jgi:hypothetical protein
MLLMRAGWPAPRISIEAVGVVGHESLRPRHRNPSGMVVLRITLDAASSQQKQHRKPN